MQNLPQTPTYDQPLLTANPNMQKESKTWHHVGNKRNN